MCLYVCVMSCSYDMVHTWWPAVALAVGCCCCHGRDLVRCLMGLVGLVGLDWGDRELSSWEGRTHAYTTYPSNQQSDFYLGWKVGGMCVWYGTYLPRYQSD
ncbi:hypothetical protein B0H63DRAFT_467062 [Podospora didyma]|uniref:Uncharacterized protein n=1 Tax=Podospora didyma TaxID=330526 RepID=A0AAE0P0X1_9PEZI|nr:hypothetical protein B0H63DRAFT_467062 [Podospora didyma]